MGLGSAATAKESRYVEQIDVVTGTIQITYGRDANSKINGGRLDLQPFVNDNGDVTWLCGNANPPLNATDDPGDGVVSTAVATDLADKYMPASCRTGFGGN